MKKYIPVILLTLILIPVVGSFRRTLFFESFDSQATGSTPLGWEIWEGAIAVISEDRSYSPSKSLKIDSSTAARRVGVEDASKMGLRVMVYPSGSIVRVGFARNSPVTWIALVRFDSGTATCGGRGSFSYSSDRWYDVELVLDMATGRYWCYIDGEFLGVQITADPYSLEGVALQSQGASYFDNVEAYKIVPSEFQAEIWVDKGCDSVYLTGEAVELNVRVNKDARVEVWEDFMNGTMKFLTGFEARANVIYSLTGVVREEGYRRFLVKAWSHDADYSESSCMIYVKKSPLRPVAILKAENGYVNESINFDASGSYDPDGRVVEYYYDFGDGEALGWTSKPSVTHIYKKPGTYYARLKVKDNDGLESDWSDPVKVVILAENKPPVADLRSNVTVVRIGDPVYLDASGSYDPDGRVVEYYYDFGDSVEYGWTALPVVKHAYSRPGNYTAKVKVKDDVGAESNWASYRLVVLGNERPQAFIDEIFPNPVREGERVLLRGHGEDPDGGRIVRYQWNSSIDGLLGEEAEVVTYLSPGVHDIYFRVMDDEGNWSAWVKAKVRVEKTSTGVAKTTTQTRTLVKERTVTQTIEKEGKEVTAQYQLPLTIAIASLAIAVMALLLMIKRRP